MRLASFACIAAVVFPTLVQAADAPKTPPAPTGDLKSTLQDLNVMGADFWVYNDLAAARARAAKENKPIFVTFRCVPCKNCAGFDAEVAKGSDIIAKIAQEKFVALRQVEMKGVDLNQFQFDYDLNWAAMFINADGTVYARYGTQSAEGPDAYNSITSLVKTMDRVLELHANYEKVKASLAAKRGPDHPWKTGLEMPGMENKEKLAGATVRQNCIHCHMINDAMHREWASAGQMSEEKLYRYPLPDNIGLHIVRDDGRKIETVDAGGAAAKAGIAAGDEILRAAGQPVTSIADLQWVLQNQPAGNGKVELTVLRNQKETTATLELADGWKKTNWHWRASRWSMRPEPGFWAPIAAEKDLKPIADKIPEGVKPLRVQFIGNKNQGAADRKAGLKEGDLILTYDGKAMNVLPEEFQMYVRFQRKVGEKLELKVLRNGKEMAIELPLLE